MAEPVAISGTNHLEALDRVKANLLSDPCWEHYAFYKSLDPADQIRLIDKATCSALEGRKDDSPDLEERLTSAVKELVKNAALGVPGSMPNSPVTVEPSTSPNSPRSVSSSSIDPQSRTLSAKASIASIMSMSDGEGLTTSASQQILKPANHYRHQSSSNATLLSVSPQSQRYAMSA